VLVLQPFEVHQPSALPGVVFLESDFPVFTPPKFLEKFSILSDLRGGVGTEENTGPQVFPLFLWA